MSEDKTYYTATRYGFGTHDKLIVEKLKDKSWPEILRKIACQYEAEDKPKPEWEILEFFRQGCFMARPITNCNYSKLHYQDATGTYSLDWLLKDEQSKITSVKRLSDGEVFTVGDWFEVNHQPGYRWPIDRFEIGPEGDMRLISTDETGGYNWGLKIAKKYSSSPIPVLLTPAQIEKLHRILNTH